MQQWHKSALALSFIFGTALAYSAHPVDMPRHITHVYAIGNKLHSLSICEKFCEISPTIKQYAMLHPQRIKSTFRAASCPALIVKSPSTMPSTIRAPSAIAVSTVTTVFFI